jgi:hypothetical protein
MSALAAPAFLVCRNCLTLVPRAAHALDWYLDADEARAEAERFATTHAAHGVEEAERVTTPAVYDRPLWDPLVTAWFEVRIGGESFVVRAARAEIDAPRTYVLSSRAGQFGPWSVDVDEILLARALDRCFYPQVLSRQQCAHVVQTARMLAGTLAAADIDIAFDDADDPNVGIASWPAELSDALLSGCRAVFDAVEQDRLARFIDANRGADGALALRIRRHVALSA